MLSFICFFVLIFLGASSSASKQVRFGSDDRPKNILEPRDHSVQIPKIVGHGIGVSKPS